MSSLSAMNHVGTSSSGPQAGTDPNHSHSPTMMLSQPPASHTTVQPDPNVSGGAYVAVHRPYTVSAGPDGYAHHHVMPSYVQGPPPPGGELMYNGDPHASGQEGRDPGAGEVIHGEEGSPSPSAATGSGSAHGKRKHGGSSTPDGVVRKRRLRAVGEDGDVELQDLDVGPNGGPKHWTEDEKTKFFTWMLTSDEHWESFKTRMNTVFREGSNELFPGRKSYTALKSCFHRNLEVFKQIHAFQMFSAKRFSQMQAENPNVEQPSVDAMLDAARATGLNVGTLNAKIIDRWYETGWYELFSRRYREDPKTGMLVPYWGASEDPVAGPSTLSAPHAMMSLTLHTSPEPHFAAQHAGSHNGIESIASQRATSSEPAQPSAHLQNGSYTYPAPSYPPVPEPAEYHPPSSAAPPATYSRPTHNTAPPHAPHPPARNSSRSAALTTSRTSSGTSFNQPSLPLDHSSQTSQALVRLNTVTETLLSVCSSLKELIQQQAEESRARTELMRVEAERRQQEDASPSARNEIEKEISIEKVRFATEILKNGPENEDIKKAAVECLTKYLMRGL